MENETTINSRPKDSMFISYSHVDNTPFVEGHNGWVDTLHNQLSLRLKCLGIELLIWRDPLLPRYESFQDVLVLKLQGVTILMVILSPRYVQSQQCMKELRQFCHAASQAERHRTGIKTRVFKVIKTPIDDSEHPEELQGLLGYPFYERHSDTDRPREFHHEFGHPGYTEFEEKVYDVAWDIKKLIEGPKKTASGNLIESTATTTVYLAETESGLDAQRIDIKRELEESGYNVLPDRSLPRDVTKLEQAVRDYLKRSRFSLHLIGGNYGFIPESERVRSNVRLQYEMAVERSAEEPDFSQLIWMPKGLKVQDDRQEEFIESVRSNTSERIEFMQDIREDLKSYLINRLKALPAEAVVKTYTGPLRIYVICHSKDYDATKQLNDFLYDQKFEVLGLTKSKNNVRDHNQYLPLCDVAMIFQDQADEGWREQKLNDLRKIAGNDSSRKLLARAVYVAGLMTEKKERFRSNELTVIKERGKFPPKELIQFLEQVRCQASTRVQETKGAGR